MFLTSTEMEMAKLFAWANDVDGKFVRHQYWCHWTLVSNSDFTGAKLMLYSIPFGILKFVQLWCGEVWVLPDGEWWFSDGDGQALNYFAVFYLYYAYVRRKRSNFSTGNQFFNSSIMNKCATNTYSHWEGLRTVVLTVYWYYIHTPYAINIKYCVNSVGAVIHKSMRIPCQ